MFDPYDDSSVINAIQKGLSCDPGGIVAHDMRNKFVTAISKRFTWRLAADKLALVYREAVEQDNQK